MGLITDDMNVIDMCNADNLDVILQCVRLDNIAIPRQIKDHCPNVRDCSAGIALPLSLVCHLAYIAILLTVVRLLLHTSTVTQCKSRTMKKKIAITSLGYLSSAKFQTIQVVSQN